MPSGYFDRAIVIYANYREFSAGENFEYPRVQSRLLVWCESGKGRLRVNGVDYDFSAGSVVLTPWNSRIAYLPSSRTPFLLGCIHIIPDMETTGREIVFSAFHESRYDLPEYARRHDVELPLFPGTYSTQLPCDHPLFRQARCVVECFSGGAPEEILRLYPKILLYELEKTLPGTPAENTVRKSPWLHDVDDMIKRYLEAPCKLWMMAKAAECSIPTLFRRFRNETGMSPGMYLRRCRLRRAAELLTTTKRRVGEIAAALQFSSPYYFSACFRREYGSSPREYRKTGGGFRHPDFEVRRSDGVQAMWSLPRHPFYVPERGGDEK